MKYLYILIFMFIFIGCSDEQQYIKIPCNYPILKEYKTPDMIDIDIKKESNKYIISEEGFKQIINYINNLKLNDKLYKNQIIEFNKEYNGKEKE